MGNKYFILMLLLISIVFLTASFWKSVGNIVRAPIGIAGTVLRGGTSVAGNAGSFVGETAFGGVLSGAFGPAIDKYDASNQKSLSTLDTTLNKRLRQLNTILLDNQKILNDNVTARENQLDEIFKTSILLADEKIKEDLERFDEKMEFRIGQLTTGITISGIKTTNSLWIVLKGAIQLLLLVILVYFISKTVSEFIRNGITFREKNEIIRHSKIYGIITLIAITITIFFNPISNHYTNRELKKAIEEYETQLKMSNDNYDYKSAAYITYILTQLNPNSFKYQYLRIKYELLKDLMYRPKYAIFNTQNTDELIEKMQIYERLHVKNDEIDPEFDIINAIYVLYLYNNKEGEVLAAYLAHKSLTERKNGKVYPLDIFAYNLIRNYQTHPIYSSEIKRILDTYSLSYKDKNIDKINVVKIADSLLSSAKFETSFNYNKLVKKTIIEDENEFILFLNAKKRNGSEEMFRIWRSFNSRWLNLISQLKMMNSRQVRFASLEINDLYFRYVTETIDADNTPATKLMRESVNLTAIDSLLTFKSETNSLVNDVFSEQSTTEKEKLLASIKNNMSIFRQYFLCDILSFFSLKSKQAISISEIDRSIKKYSAVRKFADEYLAILNYTDNPTNIVEAIKTSSELAIYVTNNRIRIPYSRLMIDSLEKANPKYIFIDSIRNSTNINLLKSSIKFL